VFGPAAGVMGTLQATEALKVLLKVGESMSDRMLIYDALEGSFEVMKRSANPLCPVCGEHPSISEPVQYEVVPRSCSLRAVGVAQCSREPAEVA
jgi:adenylyltransferase/sulfurtransferase